MRKQPDHRTALALTKTGAGWFSVFDFAFYEAHQKMLDMEATGTHAFLRDETGKVISLCNDGELQPQHVQRITMGRASEAHCIGTPIDAPLSYILWRWQVMNTAT